MSKHLRSLENLSGKSNKIKIYPFQTLSESINNQHRSSMNEEASGLKKIESEEDEGLMQAIQLDVNEEEDDSFLSHSFPT